MSRRLLPAALAALALAACSSSSSHSAEATTTSAAVSTTSAAPGTTVAPGSGGTLDPTATAKPAPTTAPPTTKPAASGSQITMSVTDPAVCPAPDAPYQPPLTVRVTWKVTNADSVTIAIDGPGAYESGLALTGSMDLNWSCPASPHTYYIEAVKNGQVVAQKTKLVNPPS